MSISVLVFATLLAAASSEQATSAVLLTCPKDYSILGESCYLVSQVAVTGSTANAFCEGKAGRAAMVDSQQEMDMLTDKFLKSTVYLGNNMVKYRENIFSFISKMAGHSGYTNFYKDEPDNYGTEACVVADANSGFAWRDVHCTEHHPVLCKTAPVASELRLTCPQDAHLFRDYACFWADGSPVYNQTAAKNACTDRGLQLTSIHSQEESDFILGLSGNNDTFIGFTDSAEEGVYVWGDHTPMDFENWGDNEPDDLEEEDCGHSGNLGKWSDISCDYTLGVACRGVPFYS